MKTSETIGAIAAALSTAQGLIQGAVKDSTNPHFNSKYADLESCWSACRLPLATNGIAVIQSSEPAEGGVLIVTRLVHKSAEWMEDGGVFVPASKADAQGYGSALTYARRYGLCAMVGIAPTDDDGNAAAANPAPPRGSITPNGDAWAAQSHEEQAFLLDIARFARGFLVVGNAADAVAYIEQQKLTAEELVALWTRFDSKERAAMKAAKKQEKSDGI